MRKEVVEMNEVIRIGNHDVAIKMYKGQRVVTFKDIDMVHEMGRQDIVLQKTKSTLSRVAIFL